MDAAAVLRSFGLGLADECVQAAHLENVDVAVAATIMQKESGGRNIWGSDPVATGWFYVKGSTVTQAAYLDYRSAVRAGRIGRQGVGPMQCTSASYQDQADALGGCWDPVANMRSGLRGLGNLIRAYGLRDGARRYNGSGPAAERYADDFMAKYAIWKARLAGATVPPQEDALTPEEHQMLADLHDRVCRLETAWAGGETDDQGTPYDMRLLVDRIDVETHQALLAVKAIAAQLGAKS
jgi:hypothetical protein